MRLWLDDERDPTQNHIKSQFGSEGNEIWVKTADEAIEYLKTGNVAFISLDHDLGTEKTGYDVAKWIEESVFKGTFKMIPWRVHSMNIVGKQPMIQALENAQNMFDNKSQY